MPGKFGNKERTNNVAFSPERLTEAKKGVDDWEAEPISRVESRERVKAEISVFHMKRAGRPQDAKSVEWHEARTPASIRLSMRSLLAGFAMLVSIPHGHAFTCFASADAVRQENPTAWPSWTLRAPGHEGNKCWYPSTRAMAHEHPNPSVPRTQSIGAKERFEREVDVTGSATPSDSVQAPGPVTSSSFDDRFSAVGEGGSPDAGSKLQRVIDLFSGPANGP